MARRVSFPRTKREQAEASNKWDAHYATLAGLQPQNQTPVPPARERAAPRKLEAPVVAAISELLSVHPRVIWAARFNSGAASYEAASGKFAPVWFHKFVRQPERMRMPDFFGITHKRGIADEPSDSPVKIIAIEAKAPGWTKPRDDREREQAAFLAMVRDCGGIGIFATDVEQVTAALK